MWLADGSLDRLRASLSNPEFGNDRYEVRGLIGRGAAGEVYAVHDRVLGREIAVKVLAAPDPNGDLARRLAREAQVLARLEHPGIVPVHDAGRLADGRPYYAMKLVRGHRLDEAIAAIRRLDDRLALFARVCEAVAFAHDRGVVHRDLKPANIMVGPFGEVLVLDWGVARLAAGGGASSPAETAGAAGLDPGAQGTGTGHGAVLGTPGFMAPEQAAGRAADADPRADVFSMGRLLAWMTAIEPVPSGPARRRLAAIAARASADAPEARYASVADLASDVARFRAGEPIEAYRERPHERAARWASRYRVPLALVGTYLASRIALILWSG